MEHDLEKLFNFGKETMADFQVEDNEESEHYYLHGERIGGYAGDSRQYFMDNNDEFQFLKQTYEARLKIDKMRQQREIAKKPVYIDIFIKSNDVTVGEHTEKEINSIRTNKSIGYLDGPEDPVYDFGQGKTIQNLQALLDEINNSKSELMDFPKNAIFRIDGEVFAKENSSGDYEISSDFPLELSSKYKGNRVFETYISQVDENAFTTSYKFNGNQAPFIKESTFSQEPKVFKSYDDAEKALIENIKENYMPTFNNDLTLFINNEKSNLNKKLTQKNKPQ